MVAQSNTQHCKVLRIWNLQKINKGNIYEGEICDGKICDEGNM